MNQLSARHGAGSLRLDLDYHWRRKYKVYKGQDVYKLHWWCGGVFVFFSGLHVWRRGLGFWGVWGVVVFLFVYLFWLIGLIFSACYCRNMFMKWMYVGKYTFNLMVILNVFDRMWSLAASCINRPKIIRQKWVIWSSNKIIMHSGISGNKKL